MKTENSKVAGWIIKTNKNKYYAIDQVSGGYPYWSPHILAAKLFSDEETAIKTVINSPDFTVGSCITSGTKFPPRMVHTATEVSYNKLIGTATISVVPLIIGEPVLSRKFVGKIIRSKDQDKLCYQ